MEPSFIESMEYNITPPLFPTMFFYPNTLFQYLREVSKYKRSLNFLQELRGGTEVELTELNT